VAKLLPEAVKHLSSHSTLSTFQDTWIYQNK